MDKAANLEDEIERLMLYLSAARVNDPLAPPLSDFDNVLPYETRFIDAAGSLAMNGEIPVMGPFRGMNISTASDSLEDDGFFLSRIRLVDPAIHRSRCRGWKYTISIDMLHINEDGDSSLGIRARLFHSQDGLGWRSEHGGHLDGEVDRWMVGSPGADWAARRSWTVRLSFGAGPRLSLKTGPAGAAEIFRLRDIPEGKARRAALRHWVRFHWRNREGSAHEVRRHLRGATEFHWNGLHGEIVVPSEAAETELAAALTEVRRG